MPNYFYPLIWLVIAVVMTLVEGGTGQLISIWFAVSAVLLTVITTIVTLPIWWQIAIFALVALVLLILTRPIVKKYLSTKIVKTNADSLVGKIAVVTEDIDNQMAKGQVKVNGQVWTARNGKQGIIEKGQEVEIKSIEGVKLIVTK